MSILNFDTYVANAAPAGCGYVSNRKLSRWRRLLWFLMIIGGIGYSVKVRLFSKSGIQDQFGLSVSVGLQGRCVVNQQIFELIFLR